MTLHFRTTTAGLAESWRNIGLLVKYWLKGRFTKTTAIGMLLGEVVASFFVLFAGGTFLSFSTRFGESSGVELTEISWSLVLSFYLIGMVQTGLGGFGLPITSADVDYVFTSPLKTTEVFVAKVLQSTTTLILALPPIFLLYFRSSLFYKTPIEGALAASIVTLVFFLMGLILSADLTLALKAGSSELRSRTTFLKYLFAGSILAISLVPLLFLIPGIPTSELSYITEIIPSGAVAQIAVGLVSGIPLSLARYVMDFLFFGVWFASLLVLGARLSRRQFYEVLQVSDSYSGKDMKPVNKTGQTSALNARGRSLWSVVNTKEKLVMKRTKEGRGLFFSALVLSAFFVVYALAGAFTSSPTSFLFILFIIGSFGSGNAWSWMEKERLWILKTSSVSLRRYVKEIFLARIRPLLLYLSPAILSVGGLLILTNLEREAILFRISIALAGAIEVASITMAGSMYFASKYSQSSGYEVLSSQGQDVANLKRTITQTIVNFIFIAPIMALVFSLSFVSAGSILESSILVVVATIFYTIGILNFILNKAGDSIA